MQRNLGNMDRALRLLGALMAGVGAVVAPFPLTARLLAFGGVSLYLLFTSVSGACVGYRLMGKSTCSTREHA